MIPVSTIITYSIILVILLLFSALFSGAEAALFSLSAGDKEKIHKSHKKTDQTILLLLNKPRYLLATILIGNNLVNVGFVTVSTFGFWEIWGKDPSVAALTGLVVFSTLAVTLFGEILPKVYTSQNNLNSARRISLTIYLLYKVLYPFSWVLVNGSGFFKRLMVKIPHEVSTDDLSQAIDLTFKENTGKEGKDILKGILKFGNTSAKQIMQPRQDIKAIEKNLTYKNILEKINKFGYSRLPVYDESFDKIEGILFIKDLTPFIENGDDFNWLTLIRPALFIPETKKIDDLFKQFKKSQMHMAIVVDEYGGTSGLVTLEDVIEEIIGDINDEYDEDQLINSKLDDFTYSFEAKTSITDFCRLTNTNPEIFRTMDGDFESLAGILLHLFSRLPKIGEKIRFSNMDFTIESVDNRRIKRIKVKFLQNPEQIQR